MNITDEPSIQTLEAECHTASLKHDGDIDSEVFHAEYARRLAERHDRLLGDATASYRAMRDWGNIKTAEQWRTIVEEADETLDSGDFLLSRLGAARYLDPTLMAVLLVLRRRLIEEHGATTAAELMMIDAAVLSHYHTLRVTGWIGDISQWLETELFRKESLSVDVQGERKTTWEVKIRGLRVEEIIERLAEKLMPLLDRSNRVMLRNLRALKERRPTPVSSVNIGRATQVNVGGRQSNAVNEHADAGTSRL